MVAITQVCFGLSFAWRTLELHRSHLNLHPSRHPYDAWYIANHGKRCNALSGATILTGSIIETPDQVVA